MHGIVVLTVHLSCGSQVWLWNGWGLPCCPHRNDYKRIRDMQFFGTLIPHKYVLVTEMYFFWGGGELIPKTNIYVCDIF